MKNKRFTKLLAILLMSMMAINANALEFTVANSDGVALKYYADGSNVSVTGVDDVEKIVIPSSVSYDGRKYKVVNITSFGNHSNLKTIFIPKSIKSMGGAAFYKCENLQKVIVEDIDAWCNIDFDYSSYNNVVYSNPLYYAHRLYSDENTEITRIDFPDGMTSIKKGTFIGCESLLSVNIPSSVTTIGSEAFRDCINLKNVTIPGNVTTISRMAFFGCTNLASVDLRYGVATIGDYAFGGCNNLQYLSMPNSIVTIGFGSFSGCTNLSSVNIPNSVKTIGHNAFSSCNGIKSLTLGNSVETIGMYAFQGCTEISSVVIPNSVQTIDDYAFSGCVGLQSVSIGDGETTIGENAFSNCAGIKSLVLGKNINTIEYNAFSNCTGIQTITIPGSVKDLQSGSFGSCLGLNAIFTEIMEPENIGSVFSDETYSKATLYVPEGTTDLYKSAEGWKNFAKIAVLGSGTYTLTYKIDNEVYKTEQYTTGAIITPAEAPEKKNYTFAGWMNLSERMPAEDLEVTATYIPDFVDDANNTLVVHNATAYVGEQMVMPIEMNNTSDITAFQFDLYLPKGISIAKDNDDAYLVELSNRTEAGAHSLACSKQSDGAIRIVCTSMSNAVFAGNDGTLLNITLNVSSELAEGNYKIQLQNIELSDKSSIAHNTMEVASTVTVKIIVPGDTDGNGKVTVNDAVMTINHILGVENENFVAAAADLDGNGTITVNDVVIMINNYILGGNQQNSLDLSFMNYVTEDADYLYADDIEMTAGEEKEIEVFMNTSRTDIQGLQCDIYLPEGMEFVPEIDGEEIYYADKGDRAAKSHSVASSLQADGSVRVVETSTSGSKFKENEEAVFTFRIKAKDDITPGKKEIKLANMELSYGGEPINPEDRTILLTISGTTSVKGIGSDTLGNIIVNDAIEGETISVYSVNGILLNKVTANGTQTAIGIAEHGTYIVKVGKLTTKLSL